jgi:putative FmdB family regulatory protein
MPIYEYRCAKGHTFEVFQSMSEDPLDACIECSAPAERVLSPPAVHFKGSGFYTTDYGSKSSRKSDGGGDKSSSSSGDSAKSSSGSSSDD